MAYDASAHTVCTTRASSRHCPLRVWHQSKSGHRSSGSGLDTAPSARPPHRHPNIQAGPRHTRRQWLAPRRLRPHLAVPTTAREIGPRILRHLLDTLHALRRPPPPFARPGLGMRA
eukprot:5341908-Alexandrium_andersonii.AAC.1